MKLEIYSLKKILFDGEAKSLNCKTRTGEITVLDHHRSLISLLDRGTMKVTDASEKDHYIPVSSGVLEVQSENRARCIVEE